MKLSIFLFTFALFFLVSRSVSALSPQPINQTKWPEIHITDLWASTGPIWDNNNLKLESQEWTSLNVTAFKILWRQNGLSNDLLTDPQTAACIYNLYDYLTALLQGKIPLIPLLQSTVQQIIAIGQYLETKIQNLALNTIICLGCDILLSVLFILVRANINQDKLKNVLTEVICPLAPEIGLPCPVIRGFLNIYFPYIYLIIHDNYRLEPHTACSTILQGAGCCQTCAYWSGWEWDFSQADQVSPTAPVEINLSSCAGSLKVLHLTDIHADYKYAPGSMSNCGYPLCCEIGFDGSGDSVPAGKWGMPQCDIPDIVVRSLVEYLKTLDFCFIMLTGDFPSHAIWLLEQSDVKSSIRDTTLILQNIFLDKPSLQAIATVGNHDTWPSNLFNCKEKQFKDLNTDWVYQFLYENWGPPNNWLPASSSVTFLKGGYYSVYISQFNLIIIVLNTIECYIDNFCILFEINNEQLKWLYSQLTFAKDKNRQVWIIGHLAPGDPDCHDCWSQVYFKIIKQYADTITGQFFGHDHTDMFHIRFNEEWQAYSTQIMTPALTLFSMMAGPAVRLFECGQSSTIPSIQKTYTFDVTTANQGSAPAWGLSYDSTVYGMQDLSTESWALFLKSLCENPTLFGEFYSHMDKNTGLVTYTSAQRETVLKQITWTNCWASLVNHGCPPVWPQG